MTAPENSYWSIDACGWVRSPRAEVDLPVQRPADEAEAVIDLDSPDLDTPDMDTADMAAADLPLGVPV